MTRKNPGDRSENWDVCERTRLRTLSFIREKNCEDLVQACKGFVQGATARILDIIIRPKRHLLDIDLKELWEHRDLLMMLSSVILSQSINRQFWVQSGFCAADHDDHHLCDRVRQYPRKFRPMAFHSSYFTFRYSDVELFCECLNQTADTFVQNASLFDKVYFPRLIVPLSKVASGLMKFGIQLLLFFSVYAYILVNNPHVRPTRWLLLVPYFVLLMAGMGRAFGIIFTSLTTKYRDLNFC
jgi:lipopolysaccharide transport system permease protein